MSVQLVRSSYLVDLSAVLGTIVGSFVYLVLTIAAFAIMFHEDSARAGCAIVTFALLFVSTYWGFVFLDRQPRAIQHRDVLDTASAEIKPLGIEMERSW